MSEIFPPEYLITLRIEIYWFLAWFFVTCTGILFGSMFIFVSVLYKGDVVFHGTLPGFRCHPARSRKGIRAPANPEHAWQAWEE